MTASVFECTFVVVEYVQPALVVECGAPASKVAYRLCSHLSGTCSRGRVCWSPVTYAAPVPDVVYVTPVVYDVRGTSFFFFETAQATVCYPVVATVPIVSVCGNTFVLRCRLIGLCAALPFFYYTC